MRASIDRTGAVGVPLPPDRAFTLFTPEGERAWVPGWSPTYPTARPSPADPPEPCAGLTFVTPDEGDPRTWTITRWDPDARRVSYSWIRPGQAAAMVDIAVDPDGQAAVARIRYRMTALAPEADVAVRSFGAGYKERMTEWGQRIRAALGRE